MDLFIEFSNSFDFLLITAITVRFIFDSLATDREIIVFNAFQVQFKILS